MRHAVTFAASLCFAIMMCAMTLAQEQPLYLNADEITYEAATGRVTVRGNVELYYANYVVTADTVSYDESSQTLYALGNPAMREPNGTIIRAERLALPSEMRDAYLRSSGAHVERRE